MTYKIMLKKKKVPETALHLNGHTIGFLPQTRRVKKG